MAMIMAVRFVVANGKNLLESQTAEAKMAAEDN
jgi:hypothetical protein